jgi:hypothetical protein
VNARTAAGDPVVVRAMRFRPAGTIRRVCVFAWHTDDHRHTTRG